MIYLKNGHTCHIVHIVPTFPHIILQNAKLSDHKWLD